MFGNRGSVPFCFNRSIAAVVIPFLVALGVALNLREQLVPCAECDLMCAAASLREHTRRNLPKTVHDACFGQPRLIDRHQIRDAWKAAGKRRDGLRERDR